jgi:mono/diheme cytochrome c family protein
MKKVFIGFGLLTMGLFFMNFTTPNFIQTGDEPETPSIEIPENIQTILDNSCYGCHNSESQNLKGKKKLSFDKLNDLKTYKAVGKLLDVAETVEEGDMPPAKILKKYPDMKLSDTDKEVLTKWAKETANGLSGE